MDIEVKENFEIKNYTSFKIGGKVKRLFFPHSQDEFIHLLSILDNPCVLGSCSNTLVSSNGYDGDIILTIKMNNINVINNNITADCGAKGALLAKTAYEHSLSGVEFMSGFPGSIGGNVYMNASANSQSVADSLIKAVLYDLQTKKIITLNNQQLNFKYRSSILQQKKYILLSAEFGLKNSSQEEIKKITEENLKFRKSIQPSLANPNAGSVFKNPDNTSAGKLLEMAGAKNLSCGEACVWKKHANFIVNFGNASSQDVLELMYKMYDCVKQKQGVKLIPEVKYIGEKTDREEELCKILYKIKI